MTARIPLVLVALPALLSGCMGGKNSTDDTGGPVDADGDGVFEESDCDDDNANIYPGAAELCDGLDNNCDGSVDEDTATDATTWYADADGDGYGDASTSATSCDQPPGFVDDGTDCDPTSGANYPGADEICDDEDNDCDGDIDEDSAIDAATWYGDADSDGYGDSAVSAVSCEQPPGYVEDAGDCDDDNGNNHPEADEICDGFDNDCDDEVDEDSAVDAPTWYADTDEDSYGDDSVSMTACDQPLGYVAMGGDCDDSDDTLNPDTTWYADSDSDTYGDAGSTSASCEQPSGYVADNTDCDDSDNTTYPGADELCDSIDNDCDSTTDESGVVSFADSSGVWTDVSASFNGSPGSPAAVDLASEGTYTFCEGTYFTNISVTANATLMGNSGDSSTVILHASQTDSVVLIDTANISVDIEALTLTKGDSSNYESTWSYYLAGGGLFCEGSGTTVTLDDVIVDDNTADIGGGLFAGSGCQLTTEAAEVTDNSATWGGGIFLGGANHELWDSEISDNTADSAGGGLYHINDSSDQTISVILEDTLVTGNTAGWGGGMGLDASLADVDITCTGSSGVSAGFTDNYASDGLYGGIYVYDYGYDWDVSADLCDFGTSGNDDNDPDDIAIYDASNAFTWPYMAGDDASFTCTSSGPGVCGSAATYVMGSASTSSSYGEYALGNVIEADSDGTLNSFGANVDLASGCDLDLFVMSASSYDTSDYFDERTWTVVWAQTDANTSYGSGPHESEDIGLILEAGTYYALVFATECDSGDVETYYDISQSSADVGVGQTLGYLIDYFYEPNNYDVGDDVEMTSSAYYYAPWHILLSATEL